MNLDPNSLVSTGGALVPAGGDDGLDQIFDDYFGAHPQEADLPPECPVPADCADEVSFKEVDEVGDDFAQPKPPSGLLQHVVWFEEVQDEPDSGKQPRRKKARVAAASSSANASTVPRSETFPERLLREFRARKARKSQ